MEKPVVFVIGASGQVGVATVKLLLDKYGDSLEVRAGVRDPDSDKAEKLRKLSGIKLVQAEIGSDDLSAKLVGVDAFYMINPPIRNRVELARKSAEAAKRAGVRFVLVISNPTVELDIIFGRQYCEVEHVIRQSGLAYCFIRLPMFMENMKLDKRTIAKDSVIVAPVLPDKKYSGIAVADIAKASAVILANWRRYEGQVHVLATAVYSYEEIAAEFSRVLGRSIRYVQSSYDQAKAKLVAQSWPEWQADGMVELFRLIDAGCSAVTLADSKLVESITGEKAMTLVQWVEANASYFL